MNITSRSKEGRKWEEQFKKLTQRLYDIKKIIHKAKENFELEECEDCNNLKKVDELCPECEKE